MKFVAAMLLLLTGVGYAHEEVLFDQYTLQASAEGEVENDLMVVYLQVQHEDRDAALLADKVNGDMNWALEQLKAYDQVDAQTRNYNTHPKYEQNRITGWRSSQTLELKGVDFEQIKAALQILQSKLQVQRMLFQPSDKARKLVEDQLISQALENFKHRAKIIQQVMQADSYRIMQININTGNRPGRIRMEAQAATLSRSADVAPAAIEAGQSNLTVSISGQIQLQ